MVGYFVGEQYYDIGSQGEIVRIYWNLVGMYATSFIDMFVSKLGIDP